MALKTVTFNYTGDVQVFNIPKGVTRVKLECWGAKGGGSMRNGSVNSDGGYGGYTYGEFIINESLNKLYVYVGGAGGNARYSTAPGGWNGGGSGTYDGRDDEGGGGGGGASDVRLIVGTPGNWYDTSHVAWESDVSLQSRIIVAGGGGGLSWTFTPGVGGGLIGGNGSNTVSPEVNQYSGYQFGKGQDAWSTVSDGSGGNVGQGGGGGGWYGGYTSAIYPMTSGCGGSGYYQPLLNADSLSGINNDNGKVAITYDDDPNAYVLERNGQYYIIRKDYFNTTNKSFVPVDITTVYYELKHDSSSMPFMNLNKSFVINGITYNPSEIIDCTKYKLAVVSLNDLTELTAKYTPTNTALAKTNIKIKEQYIVSDISSAYGEYLDISTPDKTKIDYFLDTNQINSYKNCSILNTDIISKSFYANFKLNAPDSLLSQVTFNSKYKYKKMREDQMDVYDNFKDSAFVVFHNDYDLMLVNRIAKQELVNYIETLDKF